MAAFFAAIASLAKLGDLIRWVVEMLSSARNTANIKKADETHDKNAAAIDAAIGGVPVGNNEAGPGAADAQSSPVPSSKDSSSTVG